MMRDKNTMTAILKAIVGHHYLEIYAPDEEYGKISNLAKSLCKSKDDRLKEPFSQIMNESMRDGSGSADVSDPEVNIGGTNMEFNSPRIQEKIEQILGKPENVVLHSPVPFQLGYDAGGRADVYLYKNHIDGIVYVTGDLTGQKQKSSDAGNYEFMIAHKAEDKWGPELISSLAYYTCDASINSGHTMGLGAFALPENTVKAIIFDKYATFRIGLKKYGLMLIIGITEDELEWKKRNGGAKLIEKLKEKNIYPLTDLKRRSIFQ
jgi:hypothetical protein